MDILTEAAAIAYAEALTGYAAGGTVRHDADADHPLIQVILMGEHNGEPRLTDCEVWVEFDASGAPYLYGEW